MLHFQCTSIPLAALLRRFGLPHFLVQAWIVEMAAYVKSLDPNHLLSIGSEGFYGPSSPLRQKFNAESYMTTQGTDFIRNHQVPGIDLATIHVYASSRYGAVHRFELLHLSLCHEAPVQCCHYAVHLSFSRRKVHWHLQVLTRNVLPVTANEKERLYPCVHPSTGRYSVSSWSDKLQYYQDYIQAHINDCNSVLKMPLLVEEFGPEGSSSPFGTIDKRDQVYNTTYSLMLASAKNQGAGAGKTLCTAFLVLCSAQFCTLHAGGYIGDVKHTSTSQQVCFVPTSKSVRKGKQASSGI